MNVKDIVDEIEQMDELQLNDVMVAVCKRYNSINQDNELVIVSLPKYNPEKRKRIIQWFCENVEK